MKELSPSRGINKLTAYATKIINSRLIPNKDSITRVAEAETKKAETKKTITPRRAGHGA